MTENKKADDDTGSSPNRWLINQTNVAYWSPHMVLNMLSWLQQQKAYKPESLKDSIRTLLRQTCLVSQYASLLNEDPTTADVARINEAKTQFMAMEPVIGPFFQCLCEGASGGGERKSIAAWGTWYKAKTDGASPTFSSDILEVFVKYSQMFFNFGEYSMSKRWVKSYLDYCCELTTEGHERVDLKIQATWGLIASTIMMLPSPEDIQNGKASDGDDAYLIPKYILILDDLLNRESNNNSENHGHKKLAVVSRIWLLSWSIWSLLRYYFPKVLPAVGSTNDNVGGHNRSNLPNSNDWNRLIEWLFSDYNLSLIMVLSPSNLRYVSAIAILNRQRQDLFKAALDVIGSTEVSEDDLLTSLLTSLLISYNFDEAQDKLARCFEFASADFLLCPLQSALEEHSRLLIFQTYCRIQKSIDIDMIARKLHMTADTAERWIVNLIRHARLEAKIDSERNCVEIASPTTNVYRQVLDKAGNIVTRTGILINGLDRPGSAPVQPNFYHNNRRQQQLKQSR